MTVNAAVICVIITDLCNGLPLPGAKPGNGCGGNWSAELTPLLMSFNSSPLAAILAYNIFKCIFYENHKIPIQISLKIVPMNPIDNKLALVQVMAWCQTGDKPLPEPVMTLLIDAYMQH